MAAVLPRASGNVRRNFVELGDPRQGLEEGGAEEGDIDIYILEWT